MPRRRGCRSPDKPRMETPLKFWVLFPLQRPRKRCCGIGISGECPTSGLLRLDRRSPAPKAFEARPCLQPYRTKIRFGETLCDELNTDNTRQNFVSPKEHSRDGLIISPHKIGASTPITF